MGRQQREGGGRRRREGREGATGTLTSVARALSPSHWHGAVSCPRTPSLVVQKAPEQPRGGYTVALVINTQHTAQSIPGRAASRVPWSMRAIQRLAGSKHPRMTLWHKTACAIPDSSPAPLPPLRPPPRSLEIRDYLMLQPCSHYPKVC